MNAKELKEKIEEYKEALFIIDMVDKWSAKDNERYADLVHKIKVAEALLAEALLEDIEV